MAKYNVGEEVIVEVISKSVSGNRPFSSKPKEDILYIKGEILKFDEEKGKYLVRTTAFSDVYASQERIDAGMKHGKVD